MKELKNPTGYLFWLTLFALAGIPGAVDHGLPWPVAVAVAAALGLVLRWVMRATIAEK